MPFDTLFFFLMHLILIIIFSSRRLALLLLVKLWRSRLILRGPRLLGPVILSMLRLCEESLQLVLLSVIFLFWIDLCTIGLLLFRLLLSSTLISMRHSLGMLRMIGPRSLSSISISLLFHSFINSRRANLLELEMIVSTRCQRENKE